MIHCHSFGSALSGGCLCISLINALSALIHVAFKNITVRLTSNIKTIQRCNQENSYSMAPSKKTAVLGCLG